MYAAIDFPAFKKQILEFKLGVKNTESKEKTLNDG
jgi:hypothetical protein